MIVGRLKPYQRFQEAKLDKLHEEFVHYCKQSQYGTKFVEFSLSRDLLKVLDKIKVWAKAAKVKLMDLLKLLMDKYVFKLFAHFGFDLQKFADALKVGFQEWKKLSKIVKDWAHENKVVKWTDEKLKELDAFLEKHPYAKKIAGVAVAALLLYAWFFGLSIGTPGDFDLSDIMGYFHGHTSLAAMFGGPTGIKFLALLVAGFLLPAPAWVSALGTIYDVGNKALLTIFYSFGKHLHKHVSKADNKEIDREIDQLE